jgi:hypothetical protein
MTEDDLSLLQRDLAFDRHLVAGPKDQNINGISKKRQGEQQRRRNHR